MNFSVIFMLKKNNYPMPLRMLISMLILTRNNFLLKTLMLKSNIRNLLNLRMNKWMVSGREMRKMESEETISIKQFRMVKKMENLKITLILTGIRSKFRQTITINNWRAKTIELVFRFPMMKLRSTVIDHFVKRGNPGRYASESSFIRWTQLNGTLRF